MLPWDAAVGCCCGMLVWDTAVGSCCGMLQWDTAEAFLNIIIIICVQPGLVACMQLCPLFGLSRDKIYERHVVRASDAYMMLLLQLRRP